MSDPNEEADWRTPTEPVPGWLGSLPDGPRDPRHWRVPAAIRVLSVDQFEIECVDGFGGSFIYTLEVVWDEANGRHTMRAANFEEWGAMNEWMPDTRTLLPLVVALHEAVGHPWAHQGVRPMYGDPDHGAKR